MQALRTPDDRFASLPGYSFEPHYVEVPDPSAGSGQANEGGKLRVHYIEEGPRDAAPVLLMHGEPSW